MNKFVTIGKRAITVSLTGTMILWSLGLASLAPAQAATLVAGDLIKASGPAVYYYTTDGKRAPFPNDKVYSSWYVGFGKVKTITDAELAALSLSGTNMTYRPGTRLVKITTDPKVYAVEPGGSLRWVKDEATAKALYGDTWNKQIDDVPDVFFTNYSKGADVDSAKPTVGSLVKSASSADIYYVDADGGKRKLADLTSFDANGFQSKFVRTVTDAVLTALTASAKGDLKAKEDAVALPVMAAPTAAKPGETPAAPQGKQMLTVALGSDNPAGAVHASGTSYNKVLSLNLTAGADADVSVTSLTVTRGGLATDTSLSGVAVFAPKRHGTFATFSNNKATVSMANDPIKVAKGTTVPVWVKVNITTALAGQSGTYTLALNAKEDIATSGAEISGSFPFTSSTFSLTSGANVVGTLTLDAITVHNNGATDATAVNVNMGTDNQETGKFRFTAGANEDIKLASMVIYNNGNTVDDDVANITLLGPDSAVLATVAKQKDKYVTFDLSTLSGGGYLIPKGASRDLTVRQNVVSGSARTIRWLVQNDYDVEAYGTSSGAGIIDTLVGGNTAPTGNDQAFPVGDRVGANFVNKITVAAGTMTLGRASTSPSGNIPAGGTLVPLAKYEVKASGENMELRQIQYMITRTPAVAANNLTGTFTVKLQEKDATTTPTTIFTVAGSGATYAATTTATLTTYPTLVANKTYYITYEGDIGSSVASGVTYSTQLDVTQVYRKNSNDTVDPSVNLTAGNTLTVNTGTMTVALNNSFPPPTVVVNQSTQATLGSWTLTAGPAEAILLNSLTASTTAPGFGTYFKELELWIGGAKKSQDTSSTIAPGTSGTVSFTMSPSYEVPAGQSVVVEVKGKTLASGITANATDRLHITSGGLSGSGKTSLTSLSNIPATAIAAQLITIAPSGTFSVVRDTVTNVRSSQVVAGTTGVTFGAYKFQTSNSEAVVVKKLYLSNAGSNSNGLTNIGVYDGGTTPIGGITKSSLGSDRLLVGGDEKNLVFDFTSMAGGGYTVAKNTYKVLTVKADTVYAAMSGQTAQLVVSEVEASGEGSGVTVYSTLQVDTTPATAGQAYAVGDVVSLYDNSSVSAELDQDDIGADVDNTYVVTTAAAAGAVLNTAADTLFDTNASSTLAATDRLSKWKTISTETVNAGVTAQFNYALGDVVAIADVSAGTHSLYVVTTAVAAGASLAAANALVNGLTLAAGDVVTRVPAGATEPLSASATLSYKVGDVIVVNDTGDADDGIYVVNATVNPGTSIIAASALVSGTAGLTLAAGQVTKLPVTTTELASTGSTYAYRAGDIVVIHDDSAATDAGLFVVNAAHAVGTDITAAGGLITGITLTTSDRVSKLAVMQTNDNVKRLYPTKLNFAWTGAAGGSVLSATGQTEVGRFTMGADTANAANPDAAVSVTGLNFSLISSATLTNATLHDFSNNVNLATNITPDRSGGVLNFTGLSVSFNHGETRIFRILADAGTSAGSQSTQFRFNAGSDVSTGTATWSVSATGQTTVSGVTWTTLAGDGTDTSSAQMTASSVASDAIAPTISSILITQAGGADNAWAAADTIAVTFAEKIDPASVHTDLRYGTGTASTTSTGTGSVSVGENSGGTNVCGTASANDTINLTNIACISVADADTMNMSGSSTASARQSTTMTLNTAGTALTVSLPVFNFQSDDGVEADGGEVLTAVRDAAGNLLAASAWSVNSIDL